MTEQTFQFEQIHIEVARNASDDFNLFHDKHKWLQITHNPFKGPIVLGFQLNTLIEYQMRLYREAHQEDKIIADRGLRFSNYQITFVNALRPRQEMTLDIKKTLIATIPELTLTNRVAIKSQGKTILLGYKKETKTPLFLANTDLSGLPDLNALADDSIVPGTDFFLKRKWMHNGNVKNFLSGSLAEQSAYFDELAHIASYPEVFPCCLTSGALLEKAQLEHHDFKANPMVYTSHDISVDRCLVQRLKNNDKLHILVKQLPESKDNTLNHTDILLRTYECYGVLEDREILFRIKLNLVPLEEIVRNLSAKPQS
ncbi:hypothetical protein ACQE3E_14445 [Methylomonas sp. MED-D]|uniref:Uncharacterized protein n=1 Tax=Methylomonas koyamae TaxID=702114 RepID=A0A177NQ76_9GAMM|nr:MULTISPECIES: hypothetical protein [Methylomonas]NJA05423.1 hypothetical protein [Methylococcaceae bacterium WWC4]MDT4331379.1 hypothetical protein [Methylomonas sp. MV1]OAI20135.1 hypothetical protein A1355_02980 [Methylomonas koyamae]OHX36088.1 hypothetical protein BJL95_09845 [Methylomonas sp. LWB]WGS84486.1 hypothetical protein QC632_15665 [Methylomonas sp. UP202]